MFQEADTGKYNIETILNELLKQIIEKFKLISNMYSEG